MIAVDTSSMVAFLGGSAGQDVDALRESLRLKQIVLPPVVLSELLSAKNITRELSEFFKSIPCLDIFEDFWIRTGELRRSILKIRKKARLADSLIAQSCLDHQAPLITRDKDFQIFEEFDLKLLVHWH